MKIISDEISNANNFNNLISLIYLLNDLIFNSTNLKIPKILILRRTLFYHIPEIIENINKFYK